MDVLGMKRALVIEMSRTIRLHLLPTIVEKRVQVIAMINHPKVTRYQITDTKKVCIGVHPGQCGNFFIQCERIFALKIILLLTLDKRTSKWSKSSQHRSTSNSDRHSGRHRSKSPYASKSSGYSRHNRTERSRDYSFKSR